MLYSKAQYTLIGRKKSSDPASVKFSLYASVNSTVFIAVRIYTFTSPRHLILTAVQVLVFQ
jgi:hypothetical protein